MGVWGLIDAKYYIQNDWREEATLSLYADGMTLYIENPKDSTKLLDLINEFRKVAGYKLFR